MKNDNIRCQHHNIAIRNAHYTFCSMLEHQRGEGYFRMEDENLESGMIYVWIEFVYKDRHAPGVPMYHHEFAALASVSEYAGWSEKQYREAQQRLDQQVMDKYRPEKESKTQPDDQSSGQISRLIRNLLSRFRNGGE